MKKRSIASPPSIKSGYSPPATIVPTASLAVCPVSQVSFTFTFVFSAYGEDKTTTHNDEAFWVQARVLEWANYPKIQTLPLHLQSVLSAKFLLLSHLFSLQLTAVSHYHH